MLRNSKTGSSQTALISGATARACPCHADFGNHLAIFALFYIVCSAMGSPDATDARENDKRSVEVANK